MHVTQALAALAAKNVLAVAAALGEAVGFELSDAPELNDAKAFLLAEQARSPKPKLPARSSVQPVFRHARSPKEKSSASHCVVR